MQHWPFDAEFGRFGRPPGGAWSYRNGAWLVRHAVTGPAIIPPVDKVISAKCSRTGQIA
jgi:hypothetical protein